MKLTESRRRWKAAGEFFANGPGRAARNLLKVGVDGNSDRYDESA